MRNLILMFVLITNVIFVQGQKVVYDDDFGDITDLSMNKDNNDAAELGPNGSTGFFYIEMDKYTNFRKFGSTKGVAYAMNQGQVGKWENVKPCDLENSSKKSYVLLYDKRGETHDYFTFNLNSSDKLLKIVFNIRFKGECKLLIQESSDGIQWNDFTEITNINIINEWYNFSLEDKYLNETKNIKHIKFKFIGENKQDGPNINNYISMDDIVISEYTRPLSNENFSVNNIIVSLNDNYLEVKSENEIKNVMVYDFSGREVRNIASTNIEVSDLTSGLYIVKVVDSYNNVTNKKFLKK